MELFSFPVKITVKKEVTNMKMTGENIYRRKDGRWEGRYIRERVDGKAKYNAVYARTYKEVKRKLDEAKRTLERKETPAVRAGKVSEIGRQWLSDSAAFLKKSSLNKYEDILRRYILPEFGEDELSDITNRRLVEFVNRLLLDGGAKKQGLTPSTVAAVLSAFNGIRLYAIKKGYTVTFSMECVRLRREQRDIRVFSLEEEQCLLRYLQGHMDRPALGIVICLFTGIRIGELCAMKWDDIDLAERKMYVGKTMQRLRGNEDADRKTEVKIIAPKSVRSVRTIPLPDSMMELLEEFYLPETFLLTGDSRRFVEPRTMQNRFKKIVASCGIEDANFHATRHTFATRCIELGFDIKSLSEILGHASVSITMNRYVHPTMALKRENMNRFSDLFAVR